MRGSIGTKESFLKDHDIVGYGVLTVHALGYFSFIAVWLGAKWIYIWPIDLPEFRIQSSNNNLIVTSGRWEFFKMIFVQIINPWLFCFTIETRIVITCIFYSIFSKSRRYRLFSRICNSMIYTLNICSEVWNNNYRNFWKVYVSISLNSIFIKGYASIEISNTEYQCYFSLNIWEN